MQLILILLLEFYLVLNVNTGNISNLRQDINLLLNRYTHVFLHYNSMPHMS